MRFYLVTVTETIPASLVAGQYALNLSRVKRTRAVSGTVTEIEYDMGKKQTVKIFATIAKATLDAVLDVQFPDAAFPYDVTMIDGKAVTLDLTIKSSTVLYAKVYDSSTTLAMVQERVASRWLIDMPLVTVGGGGDVGFLNLTNTDMSGVVAAAPTTAPTTAATTTAATTTAATTTAATTTPAQTTAATTTAATTTAATTTAATTTPATTTAATTTAATTTAATTTPAPTTL